ncbi:MAG: Tat pathway signal protein [Brevundimonas sp.]|nr:Tat pathway signal protein [Brevundimonas sp.]
MIDRRGLLYSYAAAAAIASFTGLAGASEKPEISDGGARLTALLDRIMQEYLAKSPQLMTSLGLDTGPAATVRSRLDDYSQAFVDRTFEAFEGYGRALTTIDRATLSGMDVVNYDTAKFFIEGAARADRFDYGVQSPVGGAAPYVVSQLTGSYITVPQFLDTQHQVRTVEDAGTYLDRLAAFAEVLDAETERTRSDYAKGATPPDFILRRTGEQFAATLGVAPGESGLATSLVRRAAAANLPGDWSERAEAIVRDAVYPAMQRQADVIAAAMRGASSEAGCWRLPDGEAYYRYGVLGYTTANMDGDEIHRIGLEQVAELTARADELLKTQGMTHGTVGERIAAVGKRPDQLYPNTEEGKARLLADLNGQMAVMARRLPEVFGRLPKAVVEIRRVPIEIEAGAPGGSYQLPALDGSRPGAYYINLRDTAETPKFALPTLTYHEAVPGHHFQIAMALEAEGIPLLRKMPLFSGYSEGWGLYAEQLADEMGVYADDPWGQLGYLQSFMFRAARLVADSGLHTKRWSREQAVRYMVGTLGDAESTLTTEVERYCVWPGQACSYKLGHTVWEGARERAKRSLGERFDIRAFHDTALAAGAIPLETLERLIDDWAKGQA